MKRKSMYKAISKGLLTFGIIGSLSLSSGMAYAVGNIVVTSNKTVVMSGEKLSSILAFSGDRNYDVYVGITGGVFGNSFWVFNENDDFVAWDQQNELPPKLRDNVDSTKTTPVENRTIYLFNELTLGNEYAGNYQIYAVLTTPGKFDLGDQAIKEQATIINGPLNIEIQKENTQ